MLIVAQEMSRLTAQAGFSSPKCTCLVHEPKRSNNFWLSFTFYFLERGCTRFKVIITWCKSFVYKYVFFWNLLITFSPVGSHSSERRGRNNNSGPRGNQRSLGRGQGNNSRARGDGSRPATSRPDTRPVQRGGTTSSLTSGNEGGGFMPSNQAWQQSNGNSTSIPTGTFFITTLSLLFLWFTTSSLYGGWASQALPLKASHPLENMCQGLKLLTASP